ncbi:MAG: hypothetical protein ACRDF4_07595 [Rhabdochlamydiaceae bacterium]
MQQLQTMLPPAIQQMVAAAGMQLVCQFVDSFSSWKFAIDLFCLVCSSIEETISVSTKAVQQYYQQVLLTQLLKGMKEYPARKQYKTDFVAIFPELVHCVVPFTPYHFLETYKEIEEFFGERVVVDKHPNDRNSSVHELSLPLTLEYVKEKGIRVKFFYFCSTKRQPGIPKFG